MSKVVHNFVFTLSTNLVPFRSLRTLFCITWMSWRSPCLGSWSLQRILPKSWSPYLTFDVNMLSAILINAFLLTKLLSLLRMYSLWFNDERTPPFPWICDVHFWLLSKVIPRSLALSSGSIQSFPIFNDCSAEQSLLK